MQLQMEISCPGEIIFSLLCIEDFTRIDFFYCWYNRLLRNPLCTGKTVCATPGRHMCRLLTTRGTPMTALILFLSYLRQTPNIACPTYNIMATRNPLPDQNRRLSLVNSKDPPDPWFLHTLLLEQGLYIQHCLYVCWIDYSELIWY